MFSTRGRWWMRSCRRGLVALVVLLGAALVAAVTVVHVDNLRLEPVLSGSMRPHIQPGDLAVLRETATERLKVGQVVAYLPPDGTTPVMHRIVSIDARGIVTKGDANAAPDPWGRVRLISPHIYTLDTVVPDLGWVATVKRQVFIVASAAVLCLLVAAVLLGDRKPRGVQLRLPHKHDVGESS